MNALDELRHHAAKEREAKRLRDHLAAQRQQLIKAAFAEGHNGLEVGTAAGISKERAYQLRDDYQRPRRRPHQGAGHCQSDTQSC